MIAKIIDGKAFALNLKEGLKKEIEELKTKTSKTPGLAVVLVGSDPASEVYVRNKGKQTKELGMNSYEFKYEDDVSEKELIAKIEELNEDENVNGILVQLPLPDHISEFSVIQAIDPKKDVDGFHLINRGKLVTGQDSLVPCTPLGCLLMLKDQFNNNLSGLNAVVVGRSNIVGKPMAQLLVNEGCTVTICHSKTKDIKSITSKADILVAAVGRPEMIDADWVKQDAVIIDVGINRIIKDDGKAKLVGDVNFTSASQKASAITPVPGGVGPMTIACLLNNTVKAFRVENSL